VGGGGGGGGQRAELSAPADAAGLLAHRLEHRVVVEDVQRVAHHHRRQLDQRAADVLPELAVGRPRRLLERQEAPAVLREAVHRPRERVDHPATLPLGGLGRDGGRGGLGAELDVRVGDVASPCGHERGGAADDQQQDGREAEEDPAPAAA
jgi:hypothetical protein